MKIAYQKLENAAGTKEVGEDYLIDGTAKAMGYVSADGTTLSNSLNISSIDDDGTGDRGVNFTSSFSSSTYIWSIGIDDNGTSTYLNACDTTNGTISSSGFDFECLAVRSTNNRTNVDQLCSFANLGDLA